MDVIYTDFKHGYALWCYLQRKHIQVEFDPVVDGVVGWPDVSNFDHHAYQYRVRYELSADEMVKKWFNASMKDLKYCPFCGEVAEIVYHRSVDGNMSYATAKIRCSECGCSTPEVIIDGYYGAETTEQDAIDNWNRRTF